jgi:thiol-disulfide isomerase/thioredoxin
MIAYHFWSTTCGPCRAIKPAIEDLKEEFPGVVWISVNTHEDPDNLARTLNVNVVPTIVVVAGSYTNRHSGTNISGYYRILRDGLKHEPVGV